MLLGRARALATRWVLEEAAGIPHFHGAYFAGSTHWLPDRADLPTTSDLDINLVLKNWNPQHARTKLVHQGVLLEVTPIALEQVSEPELVLGHYHLAGGFWKPKIIADPSGHLSEIGTEVTRDYSRQRWVRRRCGHARQKVLEGLQTVRPSDPFYDQVLRWIFPTGVTAHILLVAALQNPTVRRRYVDVQAILEEYGKAEVHETLLDLVGCAAMSRVRVEHHLGALQEVFDHARDLSRTSFSFSSDISNITRPLAIDGSRDLIEAGFHREAVFWIIVTYSRCLKVLAADGSEQMLRRYDPAYRELLGDLGITSHLAIRERAERVKAYLPALRDVAEAIMEAHPGIEADRV